MSFESVTKALINNMVSNFTLSVEYFKGDPTVGRKLGSPVTSTIYTYMAIRDTRVQIDAGLGGIDKIEPQGTMWELGRPIEDAYPKNNTSAIVNLDDWALMSTKTTTVQSYDYYKKS
jgi:hypothetical protein